MEHNITGIVIKEAAPTAVRKAVLMTAEQAKSLYKKDNSFRDTLLSEFTDYELGIKPKMKSWEDLRHITGYWMTGYGSMVHEDINLPCIQEHKGMYATEKQIKSAYAMAQLSQLMKDLGIECEVDWGERNRNKYVIYRWNHALRTTSNLWTYHFLAFRTPEVRDAFLEKHEELIKQYFML